MINQFKSMVSMNNRSSYNMDLQTLVKKTELVKKHYSKRGKDPKMVDQLIEKSIETYGNLISSTDDPSKNSSLQSEIKNFLRQFKTKVVF